jgi:hypothetical protein
VEVELEAHPIGFSMATGPKQRGSATARQRSARRWQLMVRRAVRYPWGAQGGVGRPMRWLEAAGVGEALTIEEAARREASGRH